MKKIGKMPRKKKMDRFYVVVKKRIIKENNYKNKIPRKPEKI